MAIFEITAPDGKTYEVQGNGTEAQALAHFKANWKPSQEIAPQQNALQQAIQEAPAEVNPFEAAMRQNLKNVGPTQKIMGGMLGGLGGETIKNIGALTELASPSIGKPIAQFGQAMTNVSKEANPITGTIGQIGSYVAPTSMLNKAIPSFERLTQAVPKSISLLPEMIRNAGMGGALGFGLTEGTGKEGMMERGKEALINAGIGGAVPIVGAGIKAALPEILGLTTGAGAESIKQAFKSGKEGGNIGKMFAENLRKLVPQSDVLENVSANLTKMGQDLSSAYRDGMVNIKNDKSILDLTPIQQTLKEVNDAFKFKGQTKNALASEKINEANKVITKWNKLDPAEYHTPEGLDALKQQIGGILEDIDFKNTAARKAVGDIYSSIKTTINNQAPEYSKVMKDYHEGLDTINEIKRTFSQTGKAATDTQLRKLQSLTRNNVSTNYGSRLDQMKALEAQGGNEVMPALAGQALNSLMPRGLAGQLGATGFAGGAALTNPMALPGLTLASPRIMGEAAYNVGKASKLMPSSQNAQNLAKMLMLQQTTQGGQ